MNEPKAMREIHEIREKIYEETKNLTPAEYADYSARKSKETEESLLRLGYKFIPVEGEPGQSRLVRI